VSFVSFVLISAATPKRKTDLEAEEEKQIDPARSTRRNGERAFSDCASENVARRRRMRDR